ncbi:MAG TPA: T9SS type A sorting domain-containing protein, partial [Flavobacterium sp.]|nr:T9SS type A sorting domain-containing protein [Flavobacterium sp.]
SSNSNINRMGHVSRGFNAPRLVGYAESHDEERLMYKNLEFGNSTNSSHNVKNLNVALSRMSALGAVSLTIPGPKMIWHFGDLGWELSINTCNNGTVNANCKLDTKPQPQWENNWLGNTQRNKIYSDWSKMIDLKVNEPVFSGSYTINSGNLTPKIYIWDNNLPSSQLKNVVILANFDVTTQNISPDFPYTGTWYNLMDNTPINVTNTTAQISIEAGGFRIYGNQQALLSTNDNNFTETVSITPNPSRGYFSLNTSVNKVEVYSITGQLIKSFEGYPEGHHYDINDLNSGMYIVKAINDSNQEKTMKLIKQ